MRVHLSLKIAAATVLCMSAAIGIGSASAAPGSKSDAEASTSASAPKLALTAAEQRSLQAEVDQHLKNYGGGKQIGINRISYEAGRMILTLPLPGEKKARAVGEPVAPAGVANCRFEFACLWADTNFNGAKIERAACETLTLAAPFNSSTASVHNNQTTGTQTRLLNSTRQILNASQAPSRINDTGVLDRSKVRFWVVC